MDFMNDKRLNFLLEMYRQMMNDINRHITIIWQALGVVGASIASMALVEKHIVSIDVAITFIILTCAWSCTQLFDAGYWYNRNLCIIANIERQFLLVSDLKDIHYYFAAHRPDNKLLNHLQNQLRFVKATSLLMVGYHFCSRIYPEFIPVIKGHAYHGHPLRALPEFVLVAAIIWLSKIRKMYNEKYAEFIKNSPGIAIDTTGINYGVGHGFPDVVPVKVNNSFSLPRSEWNKLKVLLIILLIFLGVGLVFLAIRR